MVQRFALVTSIALLCVVVSGNAFAGPGRAAAGDSFHNILTGTEFTYEGEVVNIRVAGRGVTLAVGDQNIDVYGIGPNWYWDMLDMEKPGIGDIVSVTGYTYDFNGKVVNIAMNMTVDGFIVELRNEETGYPLWIRSIKERLSRD